MDRPLFAVARSGKRDRAVAIGQFFWQVPPPNRPRCDPRPLAPASLTWRPRLDLSGEGQEHGRWVVVKLRSEGKLRFSS